MTLHRFHEHGGAWKLQREEYVGDVRCLDGEENQKATRATEADMKS